MGLTVTAEVNLMTITLMGIKVYDHDPVTREKSNLQASGVEKDMKF